MENKYTFFYDGPFSQWAHSDFTIDGVQYKNCEQYMMAQKALLFNDKEIFQKVMETNHPQTIKDLGRQISNFNKDVWEAECKDVVFRGNYAKFSQNDGFYADLMDTVGTELVEASPFDTIWGIGLAESDPRALDKTTWLGTNWLGEVLTAVRDKLVEESLSEGLIS